MIADGRILSLPRVSLKTKDLLPKYSGIYYVVDQNNVVMYIGKAKNIRKRWQGKSHHRIDQLKATRKRQFYLYYEAVSSQDLDHKEKALIKKYEPELNDSPVKSKEIYFSELVLQEALRKLNGYIAMIGISKQDKQIDILLDYRQLVKDFSIKDEFAKPILNFLFKNRRNAAVKWDFFIHTYSSFLQKFYYASLKVNGYTITFKNLEHLRSEKYVSIKKFKCYSVKIAQELIPQISLEDLQYLRSERTSYNSYSPYEEGLLPYLASTHKIPSTELLRQQLETICHEYHIGKRGSGSKNTKVNLSLKSIDDLLKEKPIATTKDTTLHYKSNHVGLYVKCFFLDSLKQDSFSNLVYGKIKDECCSRIQSSFKTVYLLSGCNPKIWRLLKDELKDFVYLAILPSNSKFPNNTGYVKRLMVSPKRYITPARLSIKFDNISSSFSLPFGQDINQKFTTFEAVKAEIIRRLNDADLPPFKLTFTPEKIVTKGRR